MYIRFITIINSYLHQHNERLLIIFAWSFVKISNNRAQSSKIKLHKEAYRRNLYTIQKEKERNKDSRLTGFPTTKRNHLDRKSRLTFSKGRSGLSVATCSPETLIVCRQTSEWGVVGVAGSYVNHTIRYGPEIVYPTSAALYTRTSLRRENQGHGEIISR